MTGRGSFNGDGSSIFAGDVKYVRLISIELVTSPAITVTVPVTGATPNTAASVAGSAYYTAGAVTWSPGATTFAGSTQYTATVTLTANSGYEFASTLTMPTINGNEATVVSQTFDTVTLSYQFPATATEITSAAVTVTAPVTGAEPNTAASVAGSVYYTAGAVTWSPTATAFAGGTQYTAAVTLTADSGYVFVSLLTTATINGNVATVTNNTGTTVTLSYQFPATAASGGSTSSSTPTTSSSQPEPTQQPEVEVFNSNIVNSASLVERFVSLAAAAKEAASTTEFADTQGHWAETTIRTFFRLKLISGYEDGTFKPNGAITRAEFATMMSRVFNIQAGNNSNAAFADLDKHWASEAIARLAAAGVVKGYADGSFIPNRTITREEMVVMLSRIVNLSGLEKDTAKGNFNDLDTAYAVNEITAAFQANIVSGKRGGSFEPKSNATRAEALQIIINVLNLNPQLKTLLESLS